MRTGRRRKENGGYFPGGPPGTTYFGEGKRLLP